MTERHISLTLVLHNHQPVGNFGFVFEDNYRAAYQPMLAALERHPGVRLGLHYTGPLLDWFKAQRPDALERLRTLVERGQVEVLGGGYYEPVLASLREVDRVGQLVRMADEVETLVGRRPSGAWLAERVWEPDVPTSLAKAGYTWTIVDDAHFRAAAIPAERHWGSYSTDDQGHRVIVFGSEQGLRYRIPFRPVEEVIAYLREHATEGGELVGMMGDDGEKFGTWPGTWDLCYGKGGWVERFFTALEENAGWLRMLQPSEALVEHPPIGRVYLPTGSYAEMGEWSLPVDARREFTKLLHDAVEEDRPEARWMRGGFWRSFQINYREINDLHKQMLRVSRKVDALRSGEGAGGGGRSEETLARIVDHLYQGQSNDCYWHGLFGGVYLSHMRLATLEHLIAAEDGADRAAGLTDLRIETADLDIDGYDELLVSAPGQIVAVKPNEGGGIGSWDIRAVRHALTSVMRRRPEAYHDMLVAADTGEVEQQEAGEGAVSIHDLIKVNEPGISKRLWYDAYERRSGLVHILPTGTTPEQSERAAFRELGDFVSGAFTVREADGSRIVLERDGWLTQGRGTRSPLRVRKSMTFGADRRVPTLDLGGRGHQHRASGRSTPCWASSGRSTCSAAAATRRPGTRWAATARRFDAARVAPLAHHVSMGNSYIGIEVESRPQPAAAAWWSSIETISVSESGFEGNHQGGCLLWVWPLDLAPGASMSVSLANLVRTFADRAADEGL